MYLMFCLAFTLAGQMKSDDFSLDTVLDNILQQVSLFPQEKIHLQTDKPYYISGEKIFFRAFLLNASTHQPEDLSKYIYMELVDPLDSVVVRLQIKGENKLYAGALTLPEDLPQGDYKIRAYTRFMENLGEDYFCTRYIRVAAPNITTIQTETSFNFPNEQQVDVDIRFLDTKTKKPIQAPEIALQLNQNKPNLEKTDNEGWAHFSFNLSENAEKRVLFAELDFEKKLLKQYIRIPYPDNKFSVSFYPEGGQLLADHLCNIAFKALQSDGHAANITGDLFDSENNKLFGFETIHEGMGSFFLVPKAGEKYYAICSNGEKNIRVDLPEAKQNGCFLKTVWRQNKLWVKINNSSENTDETLYLIIHSRGNTFYAQKWDNTKDVIAFNQEDFPSGVSHLLLLTEDFQTLSERLIFTFNDIDWQKPIIKTQKDQYKKRDLVEIDIQLETGGSFAISVTDDKDVISDTTSTILSEILLTSELKGKIDNPTFYLNKNNIHAADLLMMTHGWTRYDIPKAMRSDFCLPAIPREQSQSLSGIVRGGLLSKPYEGANVTLFTNNLDFFDIRETDKKGRFLFDDLDFADSTRYIVQALNKKGQDIVELYLDSIFYPPATVAWFLPENSLKKDENKTEFLDYVAKADQKYIYENGIRMINLPELLVKGMHRKNDLYNRSPKSPNVVTREELYQMGTADVSIALSRVPGVTVGGGKVFYRGKIILEDIDFNSPPFHDIDEIIVSPYGVAFIEKRWRSESRPTFNKKAQTPLGYQTPVEFYSPKYDTPEAFNNSIPDLRSTIYWQPNVLTDENGKTEVDFYSADSPTTYSILIEGVTPDGKLIYCHGKLAIAVN